MNMHDLFRDSPQVQAGHWRAAAETALQDYHYSEEDRKRRAAYFLGVAERIEKEGLTISPDVGRINT